MATLLGKYGTQEAEKEINYARMPLQVIEYSNNQRVV